MTIITKLSEKQDQTGRIFVSPQPASADKHKWKSLGHFFVDRLSNQSPDVPIFIDYSSGRVWKGRELKDKILNVAAALVDLYDFKVGTSVCISYDNCDLTFILALGVIVAGGIVASAYSKDPYAELLYMAQKVEPKLLFCHQKNLGWAQQLEADLGHSVEGIAMTDLDQVKATDVDCPEGKFRNFVHLLNYDHNKSSSSKSLPAVSEDITRQVAVIVMSSGTTGKPKAVPTTHWNCIADTFVYDERTFGSHVNLACCSSLDYVSGRLIAFGAIQAGATAIIMNGSSPEMILKAIQKYQINVLYLGAAGLYNLITYRHIDDYDIGSLTTILPMGAKVIYLDELARFVAKHEHVVEIRGAFGTSETSGATMRRVGPQDYLKDSTNCGGLLKGLRAKIVDSETGQILAANQEGLLHLAGETVFPGYYDIRLTKETEANNNNEKLTPLIADSTVFDEDGYFNTGDIAYFNDQEELYFVGRKKERMYCRGPKKVFPQELEEVVGQHPGVLKVCVLGVPNKRDIVYDCPRAFVVPRPECYQSDSFEFIRTKRLEHPTIDDNNNNNNHSEVLTYSGNNQLCTLANMRQFAEDLMEFVNDRVGWKKQLTGGIVVLDEIPTSRATGKFNKNYLRSLTTEQVEIYGDQSG